MYNTGVNQTVQNNDKDEVSTVGGSSRFGRRYRKSEAGLNTGPIKIKKIIPLKDQT